MREIVDDHAFGTRLIKTVSFYFYDSSHSFRSEASSVKLVKQEPTIISKARKRSNRLSHQKALETRRSSTSTLQMVKHFLGSLTKKTIVSISRCNWMVKS